MKDFLPAQEVKNLKAAHSIAKDRKRADQLFCFYIKDSRTPQIAELLMLDETTIRRYEKEYQRAGVNALLEDRYHGSMGLLPEIEIRSLENHLRIHTYHTLPPRARTRWHGNEAKGYGWA